MREVVCERCGTVRKEQEGRGDYLFRSVTERQEASPAAVLAPLDLAAAGCPGPVRLAIEAWAEALGAWRAARQAFELAKAARVLEADAKYLGGAEAWALLQADVQAAWAVDDAARLEVERRGSFLVYLQQGGSLKRDPHPDLVREDWAS